jgi:hypothetical protein
MNPRSFGPDDFAQFILIGAMLSKPEMADQIPDEYFSLESLLAVRAIREKDAANIRHWLLRLGIGTESNRILTELVAFLKQRLVVKKVGEFCATAPTMKADDIRSSLRNLMELVDGENVTKQGG